MVDEEADGALPSDRHERANVMYERVMGNRAPDSDDDRYTMVHDQVFGDLWTRDGLDERSRRIVSIVCSALVGADVPLRGHISAALRTEALTVDELHEIGLHLGHYAGFPLSVSFRIALGDSEAALAAER